MHYTHSMVLHILLTYAKSNDERSMLSYGWALNEKNLSARRSYSHVLQCAYITENEDKTHTVRALNGTTSKIRR